MGLEMNLSGHAPIVQPPSSKPYKVPPDSGPLDRASPRLRYTPPRAVARYVDQPATDTNSVPGRKDETGCRARSHVESRHVSAGRRGQRIPEEVKQSAAREPRRLQSCVA